MEQTSRAAHQLHEELRSIKESIDAMVRYMKQFRDPIGESQGQVSETTAPVEISKGRTKESTHQLLDMIEEITSCSGDIVQNLKVLRKSLPATYFKNRSKVRDVFERIESKAGKSQNNAFAVMDVLQFQDITSQQMDHASHLLDEVESRLRSIKEFLDTHEHGIEKAFAQHE